MKNDFNNLALFTRKTIEAHLQRVCAEDRIPFILGNHSIEFLVDHLAGYLAVQVVRYGYEFGDPDKPACREVRLDASFRVPKTWRDAFRLHFASRWWMKWSLKRWPICYETLSKTLTETVCARALLPDIPAGSRGYRIIFAMKGGLLRSDEMCSICGRDRHDWNHSQFAMEAQRMKDDSECSP